jgi:hypothetical protein
MLENVSFLSTAHSSLCFLAEKNALAFYALFYDFYTCDYFCYKV